MAWVEPLVAAAIDLFAVEIPSNADPALVVEPIRRARRLLPPSTMLLVEGSPAVAADVGAGLLLAERGVSTAEARRDIGRAGPLVRIVSTPAAAVAAIGADLLLAEGTAATAAGLRSVVEAAWAPVLATVELGETEADRAIAALVSAGAEGVVLRLRPDAGAADLGAALATIRDRLPNAWFAAPAAAPEPRIAVDGVEHLLLPDTAVADLLLDLGRSDAARVTRNGVVVPRRRWDDTLLAPGDALTIGDR